MLPLVRAICKDVSALARDVDERRDRLSFLTAGRGDDQNDPVELVLDKMFQGFADSELRASDLPDLTPEIVERRVEFLVNSNLDNPLPALVEIAFYYKQDLMDKNAMANAFEQIIGEDNTRQLLDGDKKAKKDALASWMPGKFAGNDSAPTGFR